MFPRALLAALLSLPAAAQTVSVPVVPSISVAPAASVTAVYGQTALLTLTPATALQPLSLTALTVTLPAANQPEYFGSRPILALKPLSSAPATPKDGWAKVLDFQPDASFFDGSRSIKSEAGATFSAVLRDGGAVRVHLVERAPLSAKKAVPGTEGLSGRALLDSLNASTGKGYKTHEYKDASDWLFSHADQVVINGVHGVIDAYSGIFVPGTGQDGGDYPEPGDSNGDGFPDKAGMNVEHTWPQSLFGKALPMRSDLHHLMATFMHPNSVRGSLPFGIVTGTPDYQNKAGAKRGNGVFEPPDAVKGRVARGMLYFYTRYKGTKALSGASAKFWNQQIELFMDWNRRFPPDEFEARRNDIVEAYQGNRNPFIDDSSLADRIGAQAFRPEPVARVSSRGAGSKRR